MKRLIRFIPPSASALRRGVRGADPVPQPPVFVGLVEGTFGKAGGRVKVRFDAPVFAKDAKYEGYTLALHYRPCRCRGAPWSRGRPVPWDLFPTSLCSLRGVNPGATGVAWRRRRHGPRSTSLTRPRN